MGIGVCIRGNVDARMAQKDILHTTRLVMIIYDVLGGSYFYHIFILFFSGCGGGRDVGLFLYTLQSRTKYLNCQGFI